LLTWIDLMDCNDTSPSTQTFISIQARQIYIQVTEINFNCLIRAQFNYYPEGMLGLVIANG